MYYVKIDCLDTENHTADLFLNFKVFMYVCMLAHWMKCTDQPTSSVTLCYNPGSMSCSDCSQCLLL